MYINRLLNMLKKITLNARPLSSEVIFVIGICLDL